jgi:hypothetical protein
MRWVYMKNYQIANEPQFANCGKIDNNPAKTEDNW